MCRSWLINFLFTIFIISLVNTQMCKPPGHSCADTKQCCGGCCTHNVCVDTYDDCILTEDPCLEFYCPADYECHTFKPKDCPGCAVQRECVYISHDGVTEGLHHTTLEHHHHNSGISNEMMFNYIFTIIFYLLISYIW